MVRNAARCGCVPSVEGKRVRALPVVVRSVLNHILRGAATQCYCFRKDFQPGLMVLSFGDCVPATAMGPSSRGDDFIHLKTAADCTLVCGGRLCLRVPTSGGVLGRRVPTPGRYVVQFFFIPLCSFAHRTGSACADVRREDAPACADVGFAAH